MRSHFERQLTSKKTAVLLLLLCALFIILSGAAMSIYSIANNVNFTLFGNPLSGAVFGVAAVFLGIRYLLSVRQLQQQLAVIGEEIPFGRLKINPKGRS